MSGPLGEPSKELSRAGVPVDADMAAILPDPERLRQGPVAVIECFQQIPCDPCSDACRRGAIRPFSDICQLPQVEHGSCNGCGQCVVRCPGLAIFVVDVSGQGEEGTVKLAYEYLPVPRSGDVVACLDRNGREVCRGTVAAAQRPRAFDRTALITVRVPKARALEVRGIRVSTEGRPAR